MSEQILIRDVNGILLTTCTWSYYFFDELQINGSNPNFKYLLMNTYLSETGHNITSHMRFPNIYSYTGSRASSNFSEMVRVTSDDKDNIYVIP
jgi:hypothetical protein